MRRGMDPIIFFSENKKPRLTGFCLSADFCAEHEWGIQKLRDAFGCDPEAEAGIPRRVIAKTTRRGYISGKGAGDIELISYFEDDERAILLGNAESHAQYIKEELKKGKPLSELVPGELRLSSYRLTRKKKSEPEIGAAWSERDFGIHVTAKEIPLLRELRGHFARKNVVLMMGGGNSPFENAGLILAVANRLPKKVVEVWKEGDLDQEKLMKTHERIGIEQKLKETWSDKPRDWESGCRWFALSPRWAEGKWKKQTRYPIIYWLNPQDQQNNYFGWVTIEDLKDWIKGKGKIPGNGFKKEEKDRHKDVSAHNKYEENKTACQNWMVDRLLKDGCSVEEAEKYDVEQFVDDMYDSDWDTFVNDAVESSEYQDTK